MSVYKRAGSPHYHYDFTVKGIRFRGSTETDSYELASSIEASERLKALKRVHLGEKDTLELGKALGKYWMEYAQYLKSGDKAVKYHMAHIRKHVGSKVLLSDIKESDVNRLRTSLRGKMQDSSVNRVLSTFRGVLNKARKEWGLQVADIDLKQYMLTEPEARTRWITPEQAEKIISHAAPHLKPIIRFALLTGLRRTNILSLKWEQIDLKRRVMRFAIKSSIPGGKLLELPISDQVMALLLEQGVKHSGFVFTRKFKKSGMKPRPLTRVDKAWETACKRAKVSDFRFHDLRHTNASWHVQNGTPIDLLQELLGHTDIATTKKYAHRETAEKMKAMDNVVMGNIRHNYKGAGNA